jgi:aminoglycoside phosphotransferase family enzyme/predicted kinase
MMMDEGKEDHEALISFLLDPRNYPESTPSIEYHETHISWVFVGDRFVYKIRKPVDFGFLDFTTLDKRRFFCGQEVTLNSRLAPGVYLGVVPLYGDGDRYAFARRKGFRVLEYAVRMKRAPEERLLYRLIDDGQLLYGRLEETGQVLGRFHRAAGAHRGDPYGRIEAIRANTEENFAQIRAALGATLDEVFYGNLIAYTRSFLENNRELFVRRKSGGMVREGHGDLHARHVCVVHPPIIVDCIEFNKRFRIIDVLDDMAFLFMDLEYRGRFDLTSALAAAYFTAIPEVESPDLLCFYKVYRAVVRAKIEGFTSLSVDDESLRATAAIRARNYYLLARYYVEDCNRSFNPIVLMGPSGSGKSTIARGLIPGALVIRSDEVRKDIMGLRSGAHAYADYGEGIYSPEITARTYRTMTDRAMTAMGGGERVILDATFLRSEERAALVRESLKRGLNPFFVYCTADPATLRKRVEKRRSVGIDASDAHAKVLEEQLRIAEEPSELPFFRVMRLDTSGTQMSSIQSALRLFL